jgi:signal transduction histidine kinase
MVKSLETGNQISRQLTTILDLNELFHYIVERLQREFKFYYTQIYLVEKETGDLVLEEGSGEVGRQLKENNHRLKAGEGIVGTVASTNEYFLSNKVSDSSNFRPNPLLPRTQSELAVPLRIGARVLGVLDVQADVSNRFAPEDVSLLQSIANQAAVVTENARLLAETQEVLKQVEHLNRRLTGEGWEEFVAQVPITGYYFKKNPGFFLGPSSEAWLAPMRQAAQQRHLVKANTPGNGHEPKAELAVPLLLRGEVIGVLGVKREEVQDWNEEEVSAVEAVASQVAMALENARLSQEQEKTIVQLKDVDRLKSEFLTSMSHELRTPLNSIIGFADVLLQGIDGDLSDNALTDVQAIYNSGQHLLALINDILDLAKIEAGRMELVREAIDIEEVLKSVLSSTSSLLKNKPVKLIVEKEKSVPPVYADRLRLNQVLLNLVSNATKFTEEGTITISVEVRDEEPDKLLVSVKDTGIGIAPHMLDTVFERFRQVDSSSTRKVGGTGLGLAICRQLVELHEGKIGVSSAVGAGSNFYFTIPLADSMVEEKKLD